MEDLIFGYDVINKQLFIFFQKLKLLYFFIDMTDMTFSYWKFSVLDACGYDTHANPYLSLVWVLIKKLVFAFHLPLESADL